VLPKSHIISEGLSRTGKKDFASGGYANIWKGKLVERGTNAKRICIKAIKVTVRDGEEERRGIGKVGNSSSVLSDR